MKPVGGLCDADGNAIPSPGHGREVIRREPTVHRKAGSNHFLGDLWELRSTPPGRDGAPRDRCVRIFLGHWRRGTVGADFRGVVMVREAVWRRRLFRGG